MQTQPSAQGIASLYMGNPGALQQRVQKEQQAKPGMPPDLKKLMALNIVTNEQDANKRQQAMNALNSMAPAGQEPPTVAESIQEQAKRAMQARMLQEQRKQQGLQALAERSPGMEVPEGTKFAQSQPQGIDELPVDMEFAGGGIVSFSDGKSVPRASAPVGNPQEELIKFLRTLGLTPEEFTHASPKAQSEIRDMFRTSQEASKVLNTPPVQAAAQTAAPAAQAAPASKGLVGLLRRLVSAPVTVGSGVVEGGARASNYATDVLAAATPEQRRDFYKNPMLSAMGGDTGLAAAILNQAAETPEEPPRRVTERAPTSQGPGDRIVPRYPTQEAPANDLKAAAEQRASRPAPAPAAQAPQAAPAPAPAEAPAGLDALREKFLKERMSLDPAARAEEVRKRHEEMVGRPDTSQYDRLMAELEGRRKQFDAPKAGFDAFAEYMRTVAAQGPQRDWATAGARGAIARDALNKERQAQQFELTRQMVDTAQKKLDIERGYKKELFGLTEKERDDVDKQVEEAVKLYDLSKREADKFRNDLELEKLRHKNSLALEGLRGKNQLEAANVRAAAGGGEDKQKLNELKALQTSLKDQLKDPRMMGPAGDPIRSQLARVNMAIAQMAGLDTMSAAPGAGSPGGNTRMRFDAQGNPIK